MRDYKLRKKVFNEYPTTTEVQKMIAQGGGGGGGSGETREPDVSFAVVADTPYTLSKGETDLFVHFALNADFYIDNKRLYLDAVYNNTQNIIYEYYDEDDGSLIFTSNLKFTSVSVTSSINGTLKIFINENKNISLHATYNNDQIVISEPYSVIYNHIVPPDNGVLIVHITDNPSIKAIGYLTIAYYNNGGQPVHNISCDIDISGKFDFRVDANDNIVGTHGAS